MPNTAEGDFENAIKHHQDWRLLCPGEGSPSRACHGVTREQLSRAYDDAWNAGYRAGELTEVRRTTEDRTRYA